MDGYGLAALVLVHVQRFFAAGRRATAGLAEDELSSLVTLGGNLLWAHSAHAGVSPEQQRAMSVVGATAGALQGALRTDADGPARAQAALDDLEQTLLAGLDPLVDRLLAKLRAEGPADGPPGVVARWVWDQLFPGYPFGAGQGALEAAIRARLG